jgi:hypothetical protein
MLREEATLLQIHCYNKVWKVDLKWCLSLRSNVETVSQELRSVGSLYQILENVRQPKVVRTRLGTV